jgi:hypothetical protein
MFRMLGILVAAYAFYAVMRGEVGAVGTHRVEGGVAPLLLDRDRHLRRTGGGFADGFLSHP